MRREDELTIVFHNGDRLRKARELRGYDAKAFAEVIGISRTSLRKYEAADQAPKSVVMAYALATGIDLDELLPHLDSNQEPIGHSGPTSPFGRIRLILPSRALALRAA